MYGIKVEEYMVKTKSQSGKLTVFCFADIVAAAGEVAENAVSRCTRNGSAAPDLDIILGFLGS